MYMFLCIYLLNKLALQKKKQTDLWSYMSIWCLFLLYNPTLYFTTYNIFFLLLISFFFSYHDFFQLETSAALLHPHPAVLVRLYLSNIQRKRDGPVQTHCNKHWHDETLHGGTVHHLGLFGSRILCLLFQCATEIATNNKTQKAIESIRENQPVLELRSDHCRSSVLGRRLVLLQKRPLASRL